MIYPKIPVSAHDVSLHYDELDPFYRAIWGHHLHHGYWKSGHETQLEAVQNLVRHIATALEITPGDRICDVGCGYGETVRQLVDEFKVIATGVTISQKQYDFAQKAENPNISYVLCDWQKNDLPSATFNQIISIESSEHVLDKEMFLTQMHRVLQQKGRVGICAWLAKNNPSEREVRYLLEPICTEGKLASMGNPEEYMKLLSKTGFTNIKYSNLTHHVKKTWSLSGWRVLKALIADPSFRKFIFNKNSVNSSFIKSVFRIRCAYALGIMQYGLFTAEKIV